MKCPKCGSKKSIKNGSVYGKAKQKCKECGRQYIINRTKKTISKEEWNLVDKLLLEKIPIAGISRVTGISEFWLQKYVNKKYATVSRRVEVKKKQRTSKNSV